MLKAGMMQFAPPYTREELLAAPRWLRSVMHHKIDCFVLWEPEGAHSALAEYAAIHGPSSQGASQIFRFFTAYAARGVLYSRYYLYNDEGDPQTVVVRIILMRASVSWPGDPRLNAYFERFVLTAPARADGSFEEPACDRADLCWYSLIEAARDRFNSSCSTETSETAMRRAFLIKHLDHEDADAVLNGTSFRSKIKLLKWWEALDCVREAWQLGVVADVHAHVFVRSRRQSYGRVVERMLASYRGSDSQRQLLHRLKDNYLAVATDGWNEPFKEAFFLW
jgi:hypothetical protein